MSGRVGSAMSKSGMVENVGVAVEIALPAHIVQKVFPLPFPLPVLIDILSPGCRLMSGNVGSAISDPGMVENIGVAVESSFVVAIQA